MCVHISARYHHHHLRPPPSRGKAEEGKCRKKMVEETTTRRTRRRQQSHPVRTLRQPASQPAGIAGAVRPSLFLSFPVLSFHTPSSLHWGGEKKKKRSREIFRPFFYASFMLAATVRPCFPVHHCVLSAWLRSMPRSVTRESRVLTWGWGGGDAGGSGFPRICSYG